MAELTETEENALYAFGLKVEEGVPWENIEGLSGMTQDEIMLHAAVAMKKLGRDD